MCVSVCVCVTLGGGGGGINAVVRRVVCNRETRVRKVEERQTERERETERQRETETDRQRQTDRDRGRRYACTNSLNQYMYE